MAKGKRILICPLDWGLGHATRCIPIIRLLQQKGAEVIIAADKRPLELLKKEFPELKHIILEGYEINYQKKGSLVWTMIRSIPKITKGIRTEHEALNKIIEEYKIDMVISDNRYGCWNPKTKNIFITHQLMIKSPFGENLLHKIVSKYISKFHECWIPDSPDPKNNLSGDLAHKHRIQSKIYYIGPLSRFNSTSIEQKQQYNYDIMAIVSGPEPQRGIFKYLLMQKLQLTKLRALVVCGETETDWEMDLNDVIKIKSHLNTTEMEHAILGSNLIIARSGYSTIMDLSALQKKAIFVPTPGQTEQEYLAKELFRKGIAYYQKQSEFDLKKAIEESEKFSGFPKQICSIALENRIDLMLSSM